MTFTNKHFLSSQTLHLQNDGVHVIKKGLFNSSEYDISYEYIGNKVKIDSKINNGLLGAAFFCFFFFLCILVAGNFTMAFVFLGIGAVCVLLALLSRERTVALFTSEGGNLIFHFSNGSKEEVVEFANQIISAANKFLLDKYGEVDPALPIEQQLHNIQFLRDRGILSTEAYKELKNTLFGKKDKASIGFGF